MCFHSLTPSKTSFPSPLLPRTRCLESPLSNLNLTRPQHSLHLAPHTMSSALSRSRAAPSISSSLSARISPRRYSYSGLFITSFLLAALLPFQFASNGRQTSSRHARPELQSRARTSFSLPISRVLRSQPLDCYSLCFIPSAPSPPSPS